MLIFSGCKHVDKSSHVDYQGAHPSWGSFVDSFISDASTFIEAENKKDLPLFMPAEYSHAGVRRCAANVLRVHFLVFDIDVGTFERQSQAFELAEQYGYILYSSYSHDFEKQPKFRLLIKLSRPVEIKEWPKFFLRAAHFFGLLEKDPATGKTLADTKCSDPCHMFYVPGGNRAKYLVYGSDGPGLSVKQMLELDLPADVQDVELENYNEVLAEEDRGAISELLRDAWDAKLIDLEHRIRKARYPGSIYDLKSHGVYGVARGIPHIISEARVRSVVLNALKARYKKHGSLDDPQIAAYLANSIEQVDIAIEEGKQVPWYPLRVDDITTHPLTEFGLAERLIDKHGKDLSYEGSWRNYLVWNDRFWNLEAGELLAQEKMKDTIRAIPDEADAHHAARWAAQKVFEAVEQDPDIDDETKGKAEFEVKRLTKVVEKIIDFAEKAQTRSKSSAGLQLAASDKRILVSNEIFNRDPYLLNFENGIVDLRSGRVSAHRREAYQTRIVPHTFDYAAVCPTWDNFLLECMEGDRDMVQFLWRLLGYTAIGITSEQIMPMMIGEGANGKSTFLGTMLKMFGVGERGYGLAAQSENLLTKAGVGQHATWRMSMFGKRLVTVQEVEEGRAFNESLIKEITGSDMITGRKMRQDEWSYTPNFTLWFAANHLPHVRGIDEGIWRRLLVVRWDASFKGRADKDLPRKLELEIPGIWARTAREAVAYTQHGLQIPEKVLNATQDYRTEQDPLNPFLERWCLVAPDAWDRRDVIWAGYQQHCEETKERVFHERKRFFTAIRKRFPELKRNGHRGFQGIRTLSAKERQERTPAAVLRRAAAEDSDSSSTVT